MKKPASPGTSSGATPAPRPARGFAAMNPERQRQIASAGGKASHQSGRGHEWSTDEARSAGRKGGIAKRDNRNNKKGAPS